MSQSDFRFFDLEGRTLLLTGTTRGIGKALLPGLLEQGLKLILVSRGLETMQAIRRDSGADDAHMKLYECDLADAAQVQSVAQQIAAENPEIDGLLHNAAIDPRREFRNADDALWQEVFQVNLFAAASLTRHLLEPLQRSPQGRVLFTGSVMYELGGSYLSAYAASKGALQGLTYSLAHELKHTGITVNCLVPGAIQVEKESGTPESNQRLISWQSVDRRITPADLLGPLCLLLSRAGGGISGQTLTIDGGLLHPLADPASQQRRLARDTQ